MFLLSKVIIYGFPAPSPTHNGGKCFYFAQAFVDPFFCSDLSQEQVCSHSRQFFREEG